MRRKTAAAFALALAFILLLSACSLRKNGDIDLSEPVITIGDKSISCAMYKALFDSYLPYMQYSGQDPYENEDTMTSYQAWLIDILSDDLVALYHADQDGFTLTGEQESQLQQDTEAEITDLYNSIMAIAEQNYADDPSIPIAAYFDGIVNSESEYYTGTAMSWEDYKEHYRTEARKSAIVKAYREHICAEFEPTEDDITDWYDSAYEENKTYYSANPEKYKTDQELFEMYFGQRDGVYPITYIPAGYSRIMQIVVTPTGELSEEYYEKLSRMKEIKDEYSDLAFEDAVNGTDLHAERLTELMTEYHALKESTDAEYAAYVADAETKIASAYAELEAGTDFAKVMLDYTEDELIIGGEGSEGCAAFREKGRLISLEYDSTDDWSKGVKEQFGKLEPGQFSEVFEENGSFMIICYVSDVTPGNVPIEDIYADIRAVCTVAVQDAQWEALLTEWKRDPALHIDYDLIKAASAKTED